MSSWNVTYPLPQHKEIVIDDNVTDLYYFVIHQTDYINCMVTSQLTILNVSPDLNGASFACIESSYENMKPLVEPRNSTISE